MAADRGIAVVTGASTGIGYELARCCAAEGYDLLIAADEKAIVQAAEDFRPYAVKVDALEADLATEEGVGMLYDAIGGRPVDLLLANAGRGLGHAFLDQDFDDIRQVIGTNVTGTVLLIHRVGQDMRARNRGRILLTGSIAGFMPGSFQAVYNATKAFIDSFAWALRNELKDTNVTVTCLMPGPTDTAFFERADMMDTKVGADDSGKEDPAKVARLGFEAMMKGEAGVISGFSNKIQAAMAHLLPASLLAEQHRRMAAPGTAPD
ncbi:MULTISPECIES: SDR family oxidoreductase [unclassified Chelatococcus]|uniref:SDR family NAD(P)-dependent oxidoreductase n=1 Tax=unclassified Chelatococcus TaxID=2638111 RepID=UPI0003171625|nr:MULTISPECIES: SDR family NAD(P)-dependent oxidoreductase [unclassified Chelatococcus]ALA19179.1 oxidoreductase [Chelatococcus sp. CO-6]